jgi:RimJ/RimL family protein N-acetyltransferase
MTVPDETQRIRLRPYRLDGLTSVRRMFSDAQMRRFNPSIREVGGARKWIERNLDSYATRGVGLWVIERKTDGEFLGECGLTYQPVEGQQLLEIGYNLSDENRGKGYATEAARASREFALEKFGASLVCSIVDPHNASSIAVATRLHGHQRTFTDQRGQMMLLFWSER